MKHTGGHSFGHSIITIESDNEYAVHMADILPTTAHLNPLWVTAYDDYPMQSIREKERLIRISCIIIIGSCFIMMKIILR